jgi:hypothetical protein
MKTTAEVYRIYFDASTQTVVMEWNDYATSEQFRAGTELMLDTLVEHGAHKVLADIQDMTIIGMEDQKWLEHNFIPRASAKGFRQLAIVTPKSYFNKVAVETISYKITDSGNLTISFFRTREEAEQFLARS